jgi:hypothetical protein
MNDVFSVDVDLLGDADSIEENFSNDAGRMKPIPAGTYLMQVKECNHKPTKSTPGGEMLAVKYSVIKSMNEEDDTDYSDRIINDNIVIPTKFHPAEFTCNQFIVFCHRVGILSQADIQAGKLSASYFVGKFCQIRVNIKNNEDSEFGAQNARAIGGGGFGFEYFSEETAKGLGLKTYAQPGDTSAPTKSTKKPATQKATPTVEENSDIKDVEDDLPF